MVKPGPSPRARCETCGGSVPPRGPFHRRLLGQELGLCSVECAAVFDQIFENGSRRPPSVFPGESGLSRFAADRLRGARPGGRTKPEKEAVEAAA